MCCSVHFCDNNSHNQQMHTLYFVGHFIGLPTCFDPYELLSTDDLESGSQFQAHEWYSMGMLIPLQHSQTSPPLSLHVM
jgi:hypothetical protein